MSRVLNSYKICINKKFHEDDLMKGAYIAITHATRVPPHIGMIINNKYHSLTVKGQETDKNVHALVKNSIIRKIPSVFIKVKQHSTFSYEYLNEHFISNVQQFTKVEAGKATCLSPVKLFFEEVYGLPLEKINYIFDLLPLLEKQGLIERVSSLCIEESEFQLPFYSFDEINKEIEKANKEIKQIKNTSLQPFLKVKV